MDRQTDAGLADFTSSRPGDFQAFTPFWTPAEQMLIALLRRLAALKNGACWPGREWLAWKLGVSVRTIGRCIRALMAKGLIIRKRQGRHSALTFVAPRAAGAPPRVPSMSHRTGASIERRANKTHGHVACARAGSDGIPHINLPDLSDGEAIRQIHRAATEAGYAPKGHRGLMMVASLARRALRWRDRKSRQAARSPASLFAWLLRQGKFDWISGQDEDEASQLLR